MASVPRDANRTPMKMATSSTDGKTPVILYAVNNALAISDGTTGTNFSFVNAQRDDNRVPVIWAVSSADGVTPVPIYAEQSTNKLLVNSQ